MWGKLPLLFLCLFLCFFLCGPGQAHPFHTSLTEIEYNTDDHVLEVAVKLTPVDLEEALSAFSGSTVVIDGTDESDVMIHAYLQHNLRFYSARPALQGVTKPLPLQWVGRQLEVNAVWVFLTVSVNNMPIRLQNQLLLEVFPQQSNTVVVLDKGVKTSRQLNAKDFSMVIAL